MCASVEYKEHADTARIGGSLTYREMKQRTGLSEGIWQPGLKTAGTLLRREWKRMIC